MLSASGNPELRSLTAILNAAGLRLSVKPVGRLKKFHLGKSGYTKGLLPECEP